MNPKMVSANTVLWADDDPDDLFIMREVLGSAQLVHQVIEAHNGKEILAYLESIRHPADFPCLIILDMNMPVLDGRQTIIRIRKESRYDLVPIVVFTTSSSDKDRLFCQSYGVQMFTKPSELRHLEEVVVRMLSQCNVEPAEKGNRA